MQTIKTSVVPRTNRQRYLAFVLAAVFVILALLELFWYEDMAGLVQVLLPVAFASAAPVIVAVVVAMTVFAVPYFLPLPLSRLARGFARGYAVAVPLVWIVADGCAVIAGQAAKAGYLGPKLPLEASYLSIGLMGVLLGLVVALMVRDQSRAST